MKKFITKPLRSKLFNRAHSLTISNMRYKVPKFLEREIRFFNILTFKQLVILGGVGLLLLILYYILPKALFFILLFAVLIIVFSLMFVRIEGIPLSQLALQIFSFLTTSKKYFWRKKEIPAPLTVLKEKDKEEDIKKKEPPLKISPESKLGKLSSKIELGVR